MECCLGVALGPHPFLLTELLCLSEGCCRFIGTISVVRVKKFVMMLSVINTINCVDQTDSETAKYQNTSA